MKMDANILRNIINSSTTASKLDSANDLSDKNNEKFPAIKTVLIDQLSKKFTRHLSYKVSQEAHQRYLVRLNIIETLRNWTRVDGKVGNLPVFKDAERSYEILLQLLKKYLTQEILFDCENIDNLIQIAEVLLNSVMNSRWSMRYFVRVIERISNLNQTDKSIKFLQHVIEKSDQLKLQASVIENIYVSQKSQLVEKPFTDCFVVFCSEQNKLEELNKMDILFEKIADSPLLFEIVVNQLKELFVKTEYAQETQNFLKNVLEKIQTNCEKCNKDILDLYPTRLQFCVILLRIKLSYHTENSKNHTIQSLRQVFLKDYNDALILVSHFPEWLPYYLEFFENIGKLTQKSDTESTGESQLSI